MKTKKHASFIGSRLFYVLLISTAVFSLLVSSLILKPLLLGLERDASANSQSQKDQIIALIDNIESIRSQKARLPADAGAQNDLQMQVESLAARLRRACAKLEYKDIPSSAHTYLRRELR